MTDWDEHLRHFASLSLYVVAGFLVAVGVPAAIVVLAVVVAGA